jgi:hypothetical protein
MLYIGFNTAVNNGIRKGPRFGGITGSYSNYGEDGFQ